MIVLIIWTIVPGTVVPLPKSFPLGVAIAQWTRLRLPSCRPGLESQAQHLPFSKL